MPPTKRNFEAERAELQAQLDAKDPRALFGLRALEEEWARSIIGAKAAGSLLSALRPMLRTGFELSVAEDCVRHLAQAEAWQREIASFATSGAEGIAAVSEARELQLAQALVLAASGSASLRQRARRLCRSLERVGEELGASLRKTLESLKRELA